MSSDRKQVYKSPKAPIDVAAYVASISARLKGAHSALEDGLDLGDFHLILDLVVEVMQDVSKLQNVSGADKKRIVCGVMTYLSPDAIDPLVAAIVDKIVLADKGRLCLNKKVSSWCCGL
jgi:hypothetical protein